MNNIKPNIVTIISALRFFLGHLKSSFHINFVYPIRYQPGNVQSHVPKTLSIGYYPIIEANVYFSSRIKQIGKECYIGSGTIIDNCQEIGDFCSISKDVKIGMSNHPLDRFSTSPRFYLKKYGRVSEDSFIRSSPCIIDQDVLISANAIILAGVKLGKGCVIAAGAVVTNDVEPYAIVAGIPARFLRFRLDEFNRNALLHTDLSSYPNEDSIP